MVDTDRNQNSTPPDQEPLEVQPQWRKDFPIDVPQDNYISRREFTKFLVLTSAAFTFGQFWIVYENWRRARRGQPPVTKVAALSQLPVGGSVGISLSQRKRAVRVDAPPMKKPSSPTAKNARICRAP